MTSQKKNYVAKISGGKDSVAMLLYILEKRLPLDYMVYVDNEVQFPAARHTVEKLRLRTGVPLITACAQFSYWFCHHILTRGPRKGTQGYGWPCRCHRWCTRLNIQASNNSIPVGSCVYIGINADESKRTRDPEYGRTFLYPLIDAGIGAKGALNYAYASGYNFQGHYRLFSRMSCYLCPLQPIGSLRTLYHNYPNLVAEMRKYDQYSAKPFRPDYSLEGIFTRFNEERIRSKVV